MAPIPSVAAFDSFKSHDLSTRRYCIYYLVARGRTCNNQISAADLGAAKSLRDRIEGSQENIIDILKQYATLNCCKGVHRRELANDDLDLALAERWSVEIRAERDERASQPNSLTDRESVVQRADNSHSVPQREGSMHQEIRYNLRSRTNTRDSFDTTTLNTADNPTTSSFRHRKQHVNRDVADKLMDGLSKKSNASGILYLYTRSSTPGFVKIGYTTVSVESRHRTIARDCGYTPLLLYSYNNVPHVYHVEQLVHCELSEHWRAQEQCRCGRKHREWFEIVAEYAAEVTDQWSKWMKEARPYDRDGILTSEWRDRLRQLKAEGRPITGKLMLEQHRTRHISSALPRGIQNEGLTSQDGQANTPVDFAFVNAMVQMVLAAMDQLQMQWALESTRHTLGHSAMTAPQFPSMSMSDRQLVRRDTNISVASQA